MGKFTQLDLEDKFLKMYEQPQPVGDSDLLMRLREVSGSQIARKTPGLPKVGIPSFSTIARLPRVPRV